MIIETLRAKDRRDDASARMKRKRHYRIGARRADDAAAMLRAEQTRRLQMFLDLVRIELVAMPDGGEAMVAPVGLVSALGAMRNRRALIVRAFADGRCASVLKRWPRGLDDPFTSDGVEAIWLEPDMHDEFSLLYGEAMLCEPPDAPAGSRGWNEMSLEYFAATADLGCMSVLQKERPPRRPYDDGHPKPDSTLFDDQLWIALYRHYAEEFDGALAALGLRLDQASLRFIDTECNEISAASYDHYRGHGDPDVALRRRQAATLYPFFERLIRENAALTATVDQGQPIVPAIRRVFGGSAAVIAGLGKVRTHNALTFAKTPGAAATIATDWMAALTATPITWRPRDDDQVAAWLKLHDAAAQLPRQFWRPARMKELGPRWAESAIALGEAGGANGVRDYVFGFIDHCVVPSLLHGDPDWASRWEEDAEITRVFDRLWALLFGKPLPTLFAAARDWHRIAPELMDLFASVESGDAPVDWTPLIATPWMAPNGLRLVPLCHPDALVAEGNRLAHCVGGYGATCRYGPLHILSIRDDEGRSLSTVELEASDRTLMVREHSGVRNSLPDEAATQALDAFLAAAASGDVAIDYADLDYDLTVRRRRDRARPGFTALSGISAHGTSEVIS